MSPAPGRTTAKAATRLGPPKSKRSRRTVTFSSAVLDAVLPHVAGKEDRRVRVHHGQRHPIRHSNWHNRVWLPALDRANLRGMTKRPRIHDLRHSYVSWLIAAGVDVPPSPAARARVDHTTIDRYGHMLPDVDDDTIAALDRAMPITPPESVEPGP
jgi:integrase